MWQAIVKPPLWDFPMERTKKEKPAQMPSQRYRNQKTQ
jgi:hypothetical protein